MQNDTATMARTAARNPVLCGIDTDDLQRACAIAEAISGTVGGIKLGKEFFTAQGPQGVREVLARSGLPLFLDLKFHDIPNTVAGAIRSSCALKPAIVNVHALGGRKMMQAAAEAAREAGGEERPLVIAVTILTSHGEGDLEDIGIRGPIAERAVALARLAQDAGLDGVVCSPLEIRAIRAACGPDFKLVTPGVRPAGSAANDQQRIMTPSEAMAEGSDWLVIGRPIAAAADPDAAARAIAEELGLPAQ